MNTTDTAAGYNVWHDDLAREVIGGLTETDIRRLHAMLRTLGLSGWWDWLRNHGELASRYLACTHAQRRRLHLASPDERLLAAYGALWLAQLAGGMAHWFDNPVLSGRPHQRETRAARGELLWQANHFGLDLWPFDEPIAESPFDA